MEIYFRRRPSSPDDFELLRSPYISQSCFWKSFAALTGFRGRPGWIKPRARRARYVVGKWPRCVANIGEAHVQWHLPAPAIRVEISRPKSTPYLSHSCCCPAPSAPSVDPTLQFFTCQSYPLHQQQYCSQPPNAPVLGVQFSRVFFRPSHFPSLRLRRQSRKTRLTSIRLRHGCIISAFEWHSAHEQARQRADRRSR